MLDPCPNTGILEDAGSRTMSISHWASITYVIITYVIVYIFNRTSESSDGTLRPYIPSFCISPASDWWSYWAWWEVLATLPIFSSRHVAFFGDGLVRMALITRFQVIIQRDSYSHNATQRIGHAHHSSMDSLKTCIPAQAPWYCYHPFENKPPWITIVTALAQIVLI